MGNAPIVEESILRWGSTASETMLDFPCHFFNCPHCAGIIAYRLENNCAIVFGDPLCATEDIPLLTGEFHHFCEQNNWNAIYLISSKNFADVAYPELCKIKVEVCEELIFDPESKATWKSNRLKRKVEDAAKSGLIAKEYIPKDANIEKAILEVGEKWLKGRKGPQIYLGHLNFFEYQKGKRWFYVEENGKITAMALLCRLDARHGWLLKFLISMPEAFRYTSEFLMMHILKTLKEENCHFLTYGMVPADSLGEIQGCNRVIAWASRGIYQFVLKAFKLYQRKAYWERYHPIIEPSYALFARRHLGIKEFKALSKAIKTDF